jgi:hypothetical protein
LFAQLLKFYGKEYEELKHIPISRLWGYVDFINHYNKTPDKCKQSIQKAKDLDWSDEIEDEIGE